MRPELIAVLTIGVSLGDGQLATALWVADRFERVREEMADLCERLARFQGLLDGLRDAISGRRQAPDHNGRRPPDRLDR